MAAPRLLRVPGRMLGVLLAFVLVVVPGAPRGVAQSFPRDLVPRSTVGLAGEWGPGAGGTGPAVGIVTVFPHPPATATYPRFGGLRGDNVTAQLGLDFQRMLRLNSTLFVAAR